MLSFFRSSTDLGSDNYRDSTLKIKLWFNLGINTNTYYKVKVYWV